MKKSITYSTILLLSVLSCTHQAKNDELRIARFRTFLKRFKPLSLPFNASTSCFRPDSTSSVRFDPSNDSLFLEQNEYMGISVGILPDSSNNYKLVYCVAASCWMPQLAIFSKEGRLISKEQIAQGCGSDCGYGCKDSLIISSSSELKQIFEEWEYDCKQEDQLAKMKIRTVEITYVIGNSGKIESKPTESIEAKSIGQKK